MSALLRPHGDEIATVYGPYFSKKDVKKIVKGDKLDILCSDGLNYHVEVKEAGETGRLHFRHWSVKFDFIGSFEELYLASQGTYSEGISAQNSYPALVKGDGNGDKSKAVLNSRASTGSIGVDTRPQNFPSGTRYPEDFLSKPRFAASHSRKRSQEESDEMDKMKRSRDSIGTSDEAIKSDTSSQSVEIPDGPENKIAVEVDSEISSQASGRPHLRARKQSRSSIHDKTLLEMRKSDSSDVKDHKQLPMPSSASKKTDILSVKSSSSPSPPSESSAATVEKGSPTAQSSEPKDEGAIDGIKPTAASSSSSSISNTAQLFIPTPAAAQPVSRFTPLYQQQVQRSTQIRYLKEMLCIDKCIVDAGRAIDIVTNYPVVFLTPGSAPCNDIAPHYTARQLVELLHARKKIDEVIHNILGTL